MADQLARFLQKYKNLLILLPLFFHVADVYASAHEMDTIVIRAKRIKNDVDDNAKIKPSPINTTIAGNLSDIPNIGALGSARGNGQVIKMRGFEAERLAYSIDGIPIQGNIAHNNTFDVDSSILQNIQVQQGVPKVDTGGSFGGAIELQTKSANNFLPPQRNKGGYMGSGYQSANNELSFSGASYVRSDFFDNSMHVTHINSGNIRLGDGSKLIQKQHKEDVLAKLSLHPQDGKKLQFHLQTKQLSAVEPLNPQLANASSSNPTTDKDITSTVGKIEYSLASEENSWLDFYARLYHSAHHKIYDTSKKHSISRNGVKIANQSIIKDDEHQINYGIEGWQEKASDPQTTQAKAKLLAFYLAHQWQPLANNNLQILPALRLDNYRRSAFNKERHFSPQISLRYKPLQQLTLMGKYAHAFRPPTFQEAFASGEHFKGRGPIPNNYFIPNYNLIPEKLNTFEIGARVDFYNFLYKEDNAFFEFKRFIHNVRDYISYEVNLMQGSTQFVNIKRAHLQGFEIIANYNYAKLNMQISLARTDGKNKTTGKYLSTLTPLTLTSQINYQLNEEFMIGWKVGFATANRKINKAIDRRAGYGVHNLLVKYLPEKYANVEINAGIDNIFDKSYTPAFAGSLAGGVSYKLQLGISI